MLDCVQKKAAKFADHMSDLVWETLAHRSKMARICVLFKVHSGEWAWKTTRDWLQGQCYLSLDDHDRKIRSRQQRTYREIFLCELDHQTLEPAEVLVTFPCRSHIFKKRVREIIIGEVKGFET
jgi:hypothetical protein